MSTIRDTCFGIYHTFIGGALPTNTEYSLHASQMLTQMAFFIRDSLVHQDDEVIDGAEGGNFTQYQSISNPDIFFVQDIQKMHLPDPSTFSGIIDILTLAVLMELGNVVSFWSYQETESSESLHERGRMIHARACVRELVDWIFSRYELYDPQAPGDFVDGKVHLYWVYLVHHAQLLVAYKRQATDHGMDWSSSGTCPPKVFEKAVEQCFAHERILQKMYANQRLRLTRFAWPGVPYAVRKRPNPTELKG